MKKTCIYFRLGFAIVSTIVLPTSSLMAKPPASALDLYAISDEFNTYHTPDLGERAVEKIIPAETTTQDATARLNTAGAYCLRQHKPNVVECGALISVVTGEGDFEPVRWSIKLNVNSGRVIGTTVELS